MEENKTLPDKYIKLIENYERITIIEETFSYEEIILPNTPIGKTKHIVFHDCNFHKHGITFTNNNDSSGHYRIEIRHTKLESDYIQIETQNIKKLIFRNLEISQNTTLNIYVKSEIIFDKIDLKGSIEVNPYHLFSTDKTINLSNINNESEELQGRISIDYLSGYSLSNCSTKELEIRGKFLEDCSTNNHYNKDCKFDNIHIYDSTFESITSFQNTIVNTIKLDKVQFNDRTYFDDFKILEPTKCDKITHRIIKQELQKTENRIDFDKFRSYELEAYKKELSEKENWYHGDLLILRLNSLFSKHGTSWGRSLFMTILFSFFFFTCLYAVKRFKNQIGISQMNCDHYLSSYFRFSLITNFYDPIPKSRDIKYLQTFWEWVPFIFGKITIGYGLYETIQSFRKYKK